MSLKFKLILLALLPLVLVSISTGWIYVHQVRDLGERETKTFENSLIAAKEQALKDYISLAIKSIDHIYANAPAYDETAQREVKAILSELSYGQDGYFFVYDEFGTNLVHPVLPDLVGENLINLQDSNGNYLIQSLLKKSQSGGGFHHYLWQKPSTGEIVPKLSYSEWLPKWRWMIGTGLYIEDVRQQVAKVEEDVSRNINNTFVTIATVLSVTIVVIILLTLVINLHEHRVADENLKELAHKTVLIQEEEKKRLSRELHDSINQLLVSVKCRLELLSKCINRYQDNKAQEHINRSEHALVEAIQEVRRISHNLRPSTLDDIGLKAALDGLLSDFSEDTGLVINSQIGRIDMGLSADISTTLYRIVQEALSNIEKHAEATRVDVNLELKGSGMCLTIVDNGVGFSVKEALVGRGIGLRNIRERVEFIGGSLSIESESAKGAQLRVELTLT